MFLFYAAKNESVEKKKALEILIEAHDRGSIFATDTLADWCAQIVGQEKLAFRYREYVAERSDSHHSFISAGIQALRCCYYVENNNNSLKRKSDDTDIDYRNRALKWFMMAAEKHGDISARCVAMRLAYLVGDKLLAWQQACAVIDKFHAWRNQQTTEIDRSHSYYDAVSCAHYYKALTTATAEDETANKVISSCKIREAVSYLITAAKNRNQRAVALLKHSLSSSKLEQLEMTALKYPVEKQLHTYDRARRIHGMLDELEAEKRPFSVVIKCTSTNRK